MISLDRFRGVLAGIFLLGLAAIPAMAQRSYIKVNPAFQAGLGTSLSMHSANGIVTNNKLTNLNVEQNKINFASGLVLQVAGGHFFTENLGAELGIGYLLAKDHKSEIKYYYSAFGISENMTINHKAPLFMVQPALVVRMNPSTLTPYGRIGFTYARVNIKETVLQTFWNQSLQMDAEYTGGPAFGFQSGLGADLRASEGISFFAEITLNNLSWSPDKWEMLNLLENGEPVMYKVKPSEQKTLYQKQFQYHYDQSGQLITTGPSYKVKFTMPMNSLGLGFGVKATF